MKYLFITFLFLPFFTFGQSSDKSKLILTREDNNEWLDSFQDLNDNEIRNRLSNRILLDTNTYVLQPNPDAHIRKAQVDSKVSVDSSKSRTECRPLIIIDNQPFSFKDRASKEKIERLAEIISEGQFKNTKILRDANATAIYGARARCGAFILETDSHQTRQNLKELGQ